MDDGQLICRPDHADRVLRALDLEAAQDGASRATGTDAKSVARVLGSAAALEACGAWQTAYIRDTTSSDPARQTHVLGVDFGEEFSATKQLQKVTKTVAEIHKAIAQLNDTASELILLRKCADVSRIVHLLRAAGTSVHPNALLDYDNVLALSVERCLGGQFDELARLQASLGVADGGIGMRQASATALPAFLASRAESRWLVSRLLDDLDDVCRPAGLLSVFDT